MKKLRQRKGVVALAVLSVVLFVLAGHCAWDGLTHRGNGVWLFGGDKPGTGGQIGTDEFEAVIPEAQYKRNCYGAAGLFFVFGAGFLWEVTRAWKARNDLENSWERMIANPDNLQEVHKHPERYRDDFKRWINQNHPALRIWTVPPDSSN